jgi:hypothetical protein
MTILENHCTILQSWAVALAVKERPVMDIKISQQIERDYYLAQAGRDELAERIACCVRQDGSVEPLPGLHLIRRNAPTGAIPGVLNPAFCVIAQGRKDIFLGDTHYRYDPAHYLLVAVGLPITGQVAEASPERPYLSLRLDLDLSMLGSVVVEAGQAVPQSHGDVRAMAVSHLDGSLLDGVVRLVRLVDSRAHEPNLQGNREAEGRVRPAGAHRGSCPGERYECLGLPPPL